MKVLIIQNCRAESVGLYERYLKDRGIPYFVFRAYSGKRFPPQSRYDAFIVGGTPISANDFGRHRFLKNEWRYLKKALSRDMPFLGICFGAQILARLLGGEVKKNHVMEIGGYDVRLTDDGLRSRFFRKFPRRFPVFHWHGDTFTVPPGGKLLAIGEACHHQAFSYGRVLGLLFHLEIDAGEAGRWAAAYPQELKLVSKTAAQVKIECRQREPEMQRLAYRLLDDFFTSL